MWANSSLGKDFPMRSCWRRRWEEIHSEEWIYSGDGKIGERRKNGRSPIFMMVLIILVQELSYSIYCACHHLVQTTKSYKVVSLTMLIIFSIV